MKELKDLHGFKMNENEHWIVFEKKVCEFKTLKIYKNKAWKNWHCDLIQRAFSDLHKQNSVMLNSHTTVDWVLKLLPILQKAGEIFEK